MQLKTAPPFSPPLPPRPLPVINYLRGADVSIRSDKAERPEKEVELESRMIGGEYLVRFGGLKGVKGGIFGSIEHTGNWR